MHRRTVVVGLPAVFALPVNAQTVAPARLAISAAQESLTGFRREFLRFAAAEPLAKEFDPIRSTPVLAASDERIRLGLQLSLEATPAAEQTALIAPKFASFAAQSAKFTPLVAKREEIVPLNKQASLVRPSRYRRVKRMLEILFDLLDLADAVESLLDFSERHPRLSALVVELERAISARDFEATLKGIEAFLEELLTSSLGDLLGFIPSRFYVRLFLRCTTRFAGFIGIGLLALEIANAVRAVAQEVYGA